MAEVLDYTKSSGVDVTDYGGYDSDLEEPDPKPPLVTPDMDSKLSHPRAYKTNSEKLGGFDSMADKEMWKVQAFQMRKLDAYSRHVTLINNYVELYGGKVEDFKRDQSKDRNDYTVLAENHRFLWDERNDTNLSWEARFAKKYYDRLFKEYCVGDLSRCEDKKIALRWRTEGEVKSGKGQFVCGEKRCKEGEMLSSWEVNFGYVEQGEKKNALVKIRLCPECSVRLNMVKKVKKVSKKKKRRSSSRKEGKRKRRRNVSSEERDEAESSATVVEEETIVPEGSEKNVWSGPAPETLVKSTNDQMADFLEEMFM